MTAGRSNDAVILEKARELLRAHANGESLAVRKAMLGALFGGQYNAYATVFYCKYFNIYTQKDDGSDIILKADAIAALVTTW